MANLADLLVHIGVDADDLTSGIEDAVSSVESNIGKITAIGATAGAGLEAYARAQAPLREQATRIAAATGEQVDTIRDLALEAANVTFPIEEAYASMEAGRQQGIKSGEQLQEFATFWDMVGDATGESGPELAKASVALRAVGIEAGNDAEALGALGFITEETTSTTGDFLKFLERTGPELRELGADVDDAAAILGILESEFGMSGRTARTEFRQAVNESDGTLQGLLDTLGISGDTFDTYQQRVADSSGVIQRNADIHADSYTVLQKVQHAASELMHRYSGLFDVASTLAVPLMALGPAAKGVTTAFSFLSSGIPKLVSGIGTATAAIWSKVAALGSWAAATVAQGASAVASMAGTAAQFIAHYARMAAAALANAARMALSWIIAMGPIAIVIALVVGLVALIIANWDTIVEWTRKAWEWVSEAVSAAWEWVKSATSTAVDAVVGFFTNLRDRAVELATNLRDRVVEWFTDLRDRAVDLATNLRDRVVEWFTNLRNNAIKIAEMLRERVVDKVTELRDKAVEFVTELKDKVVELFTGLKDSAIEAVENLVDRVRQIKDDVLGFFAGAGRWLWDAGRNIVQGLIDGISSMVRAVGRAISGVVERITWFLPWSPAKMGPLRTNSPEQGGRNIAALMAAGMASEADRVAAASSMLAAAATPTVGAFRAPGVSGLGTAAAARGGDGFSIGEMHVHYPTPEPASATIPRAHRRLSALYGR